MMLSLKLIFNNSFMTTERLNIKNGPFAAFWMAGTITEQLAKKTILSTQTNNLIPQIIQNTRTLPLRISGILMKGAVVLYTRKTQYMLIECEDFIQKIMLSLKPKPIITMKKCKKSSSKS